MLVGLLAGCGGELVPQGQPAGVEADPVQYPQSLRAIAGLSPAPRDPLTAADAARVVSDGFHWLRFEIEWDRVERSPGVWDFAQYDAELDLVRAAGMEPMALLVYGNPLYPPEGGRCRMLGDNSDSYKCPPADPQTYARFAGEAARYFAGRIQHYELWNEANNWFRFWPVTEGGDAAAYARLLDAASRAIHGQCSDCTVVSGGLVYLDAPPLVEGQVRFMETMQAAVPDLFTEVVDAIGFHHYTFYPPVAAPEDELWPEVSLEQAIRNVRQACGDCRTAIHITETGWTTSAGFSEHRQAQYALRGLLIAMVMDARSWMWWSLRMLDGSGEKLIAPQEASFGLWRSDNEPRPAYVALARLLNDYGQATQIRDLRARYGLEPPAQWAVELSGGGLAPVTIVWQNGDHPDLAPAPLRGAHGVNLITGQTVVLDRLSGDPVAMPSVQP